MACSAVPMCGHTIPYAPRSSACLASHWLRSSPFGGMRTNGVTAGATEPALAICAGLRRYCRASWSAFGSQGLCSISNTTPSYGDVLKAMAVVRSALANEANAGLPLSQARITPLRRLAFDILTSPLGETALGENLIQPPVYAAGVLFKNLIAVCCRQMRCAINVPARVIEAMPRFG